MCQERERVYITKGKFTNSVANFFWIIGNYLYINTNNTKIWQLCSNAHTHHKEREQNTPT